LGKRVTFWISAVKSMAAAIMFFSTIVLSLTVAPWLETRFYPPVGKITITSMADNGDGTTTLYVEFDKFRDCEYIGMAWFRGTYGTEFQRVSMSVVPLAVNGTSIPTRPIGHHRAGPWIIGVPIDEIMNNSSAQIFHRCNPLWMTTSEFHP